MLMKDVYGLAQQTAIYLGVQNPDCEVQLKQSKQHWTAIKPPTLEYSEFAQTFVLSRPLFSQVGCIKNQSCQDKLEARSGLSGQVLWTTVL